MMTSGSGPDGLRVAFDDERAVSNAGVMLVATLAEPLGIEALSAQARQRCRRAWRLLPAHGTPHAAARPPRSPRTVALRRLGSVGSRQEAAVALARGSTADHGLIAVR
jgi:hypothetical protein